MLNNNNKNVINRLSKRSLKANKMRNIFAILAIALTTLLITTTITAGITFYKTNRAYNIISSYGVDGDGYININDESLKKLESIDNVDKIGVTQLASMETIKNKEFLNEHVIFEAVENKTAYEMMTIVPIDGTYPKSEKELLAPTWVLELLGVEKKVGEEVKIELVLNDKLETFTFTLCGYYESLISRGNGRTKLFVSEEFVEKNNKGIINEEGSRTAYVTLKTLNDKTSYDVAKEEFKKVGEEVGSPKYKVHPKYDKESGPVSSSETGKKVVAIIIGLIIVMLTGYLIIYNIFHISVTRDIKFYGLLKTIGTTSKQLKKIIIKQALILSVVGIPIGLVLGYLVASYILPLALKRTFLGNIVVISTNSYIFIASVIFSLITVIISCSKPGKIAGKVSPIEAVRYVSSDASTSKKKSKKGINGAKVHKMAWSNILKSKKRVALSIVSISLSAIIVIFTVNASMGMNAEAHADNQMLADITINNNISHSNGDEEYQPITEDFIESVKNLDIVEEVRPQYSALSPFADGFMFDFGVEIVLEEKFKEEIKSLGDSKEKYLGFNAIDENTIHTQIVSLDANRLDKDVENLDVINGEINKEKFKSGDYIIYYPYGGEVNILKSGDKIPLTFKIRDENGNITEIKKEFEIMAIVADNSGGWAASNLKRLNIEENSFKELFPEYKNYVSKIDVEIKEGVDLKEADKIVEELMIESGNRTVNINSKNFYIEGIKEMQSIFVIVGGIVAGILGLIGAINVINTILTGVFARKVEFAMLESIGMTEKQIKKLMVFEGLYYILLTSALIIPLGLVVAYVAPMMIPIYGGFNFGIYSVSVIIAISINSILMLIIPLIGYKLISKESIIERLRVTE